MSTRQPALSPSDPRSLRASELPSLRLALLATTAALLTLAYLVPLIDWFRLAAGSMMYSCVLLVPFISAYLVRERRAQLPQQYSTSALFGSIALVAGFSMIASYWTNREAASAWHPHDRLALVLGTYLLFLVSAGFYLLGVRIFRALAFPICFLAFILPLPTALEHGLEIFFQYTSAEAAALMFSLSGTPVLRDGLTFQLPGITLEVARECSGINSSYVLLITSLIAGHLFLKKPWKRVVLALFVVPLAIARNGFRIVTIGLLCVQISPDMIHSIIHRRGGPLFFALSLVPFFLVLLWLRRGERG